MSRRTLLAIALTAAVAAVPLTDAQASKRRVPRTLAKGDLVVSWTIAGAEPLSSQRELLGRLRFASTEERAWLRERLREHCSRYFPDVHAP